MTLRVGLLNTARINERILGGARLSERATVVAVGSRDGAKAKAYAAERGIPRAHGSYEALLADPEVDAVYISLPNGLHHEWTMRALAAGKHVLCEKPYSTDVAEVSAAFDLAAARGLILMGQPAAVFPPYNTSPSCFPSSSGLSSGKRSSFGTVGYTRRHITSNGTWL